MFECNGCCEKFENKSLMKIACGKNGANYFYLCKDCIGLLNIKNFWFENNEFIDHEFCNFCGRGICEVRNFEYGRYDYFGYYYENKNYSVGVCDECFDLIPTKFNSNIS